MDFFICKKHKKLDCCFGVRYSGFLEKRSVARGRKRNSFEFLVMSFFWGRQYHGVAGSSLRQGQFGSGFSRISVTDGSYKNLKCKVENVQ
jgi:hypothetical protein